MASNAFHKLSTGHEVQIRAYLKFMRSKREIALKQLVAEIDDFKNDRIMEDVYTRAELLSILDELAKVTEATSRQDMGMLVNMSSLLIAQGMEVAEQNDLELVMDASIVEDKDILDAIEKMALDMPTVKGTLSAKRGQDDFQECKQEDVRVLRERLEKSQEDLVNISRDKSILEAEVNLLTQQLLQQETKESDSYQNEEIESLRAKLSEEMQENERRLKDSRQFQQLRSLLREKSDQVVDLRRRLAQYEQIE